MFNLKKFLFLLIFLIIPLNFINAQFIDNFDKEKLDGWFFFTGDGNPSLDFVQKDGYAQMRIDATMDKDNVWWTTIKKNISDYVDLSLLADPDYELRVEARVRSSAAPRRVNFMVNTQKTTDYHWDLMEFDIADTSDWYTISMTTRQLDAIPGDSLFVQFCATDYGYEKYTVDIDYYRADIINVKEADPDKGVLLPYHPPMPEASTFSTHLDAEENGMINSIFPTVNFGNWEVTTSNGKEKGLTVNSDQWILLRWDFSKHNNSEIKGTGLLELTTQSLMKGGKYIKAYGNEFGMEFGKIRIIEILDGDPNWTEDEVTFNNFLNNKNLYDVINGQMVIDEEVSEASASKNYITINQPVLQRLVDGKTKGLLIRPLGAISASFYSNSTKDKSPRLHFNTK